MNQPKIIIEAHHSPKLHIVDPPVFTERSNDENGSMHSTSEFENGATYLHEQNNLLKSNTSGITLSNTSFEGSEDDRLQLTNSNSFNNGDQSYDSMSDSQSTKSSERAEITTQTTTVKKQKKRNRISQMIAGVSAKSKSELFQKLFKNMAPDELLISDYSCALQRDILVHGRLYLSQTWLCFYANIFGWETLVTIRWIDITAITKEKTAKLIPNAIQIFTDTDKYFFSTFVSREHAYTALFRIWQNALLGQPVLPAELKNICKRKTNRGETREGTPMNGEHIETGDEMLEYDEDDKSFVSSTSECIQNDMNGSTVDEINIHSENGISHAGDVRSPCEEGSSDNARLTKAVVDLKKNPNNVVSVNGGVHDKVNINSSVLMQEDKKLVNPVKKGKRNMELSLSSPVLPKMQVLHPHGRKNPRKHSRKHTRPSYPSYHLKVPNGEGETTSDNDSEDERVMMTRDVDEDVLCPCHESHALKGTEYANEEFNFDVDALYQHLFAQESDMMKTVFVQQKFQNTKYTPYQREDDGSHSQILSYTIPLNYSIGPKQCNTVTKHIMPKDNTPGSFHIVKTKSTSFGIPYGDCFYVSTQYCITRASGNRSRLRVTSDIVYTKRVFGLVKNMISRGSHEALRDYTSFLLNVLKSESDLLSYKNISLPSKPKLTKTKSNESTKLNYVETRKKSLIDDNKTVISSKEEIADENSELKIKTSVAKLSHFVIVFCLLLLMNLYMLSRLRSLEKSVLVSNVEWLPDKLPSTKEEWDYLLDYQKKLHELELTKLKEVVGNTASLLEQMQLSMKMLYNNIEINGIIPTSKKEIKH